MADLATVALLSPEQKDVPRQKHCLQLSSVLLWLNHSFLPPEEISVHMEEGNIKGTKPLNGVI